MKAKLVYVANHWEAILIIYVCSLALAAFLFAAFENRTFGEGLWWSVVTALTIGYGDLSPATTAGRIMGVIFGHFWVFGIIPMVVANILMRMLEDKDSFTHEEQEWIEDALQTIAEKIDAKLPAPPKREY